MTDQTFPTEELLTKAIDKFWESYPPFWNEIRTQIREAAILEHGLTVEQFHILRHINHGQSTVKELAEAKGISRPAISQAVDSLVNKQLIQRQGNTDDRRYVTLNLTVNGKVLLDAVSKKTREWMKARLSILNETELEQFIVAMETLKKINSL